MQDLRIQLEEEYDGVDFKAEGYGIAIGVDGDWDAIFCDSSDDLEDVREDVEQTIDGLGGSTSQSMKCPSCGGPTSISGEPCESCH